MSAQGDSRHYPGELSLGELVLGVFRFYLQYGRLLVLVALPIAIALAVFVSTRPLYSVTAVIETPALGLEEWRRAEPLLPDRQMVDASLAMSGGPAADSADAQRLRRRFLTPVFWERQVRYESALHRDDLRQTPNIDLRKSGALGLEVQLSVRDEAQAVRDLRAVAAHVREVLLWNDLQKNLQELRSFVSGQRPTVEIERIKLQYAIEQDGKRVGDMRKLLESYPELRRMDANTVVSVQDGGGKYLSPLAQIVALQATISESNAKLRDVERQEQQLDWYRRFLDGSVEATATMHSGSALADWLQARKRKVFADAAPLPPLARQVEDELSLRIEGARLRADSYRFHGVPSLSLRPKLSRRPLVVGAAAFVAIMLLLSLLLVIYRVTRQLAGPQGEAWDPWSDPLFAWIPRKIRHRLIRRLGAPS